MILIEVLKEGCLPERAHDRDAGLDLRSKNEVLIEVGKTEKVPCGIRVEIPAGHVGMIFPRSGLSTKKGIRLKNTVGIIDSDYRGEIICFLENTGSYDYRIEEFERVAQLVVLPCLIGEIFEVDEGELSETTRSEGGFGHTG
jgi:dUTP pyrophosphatase